MSTPEDAKVQSQPNAFRKLALLDEAMLATILQGSFKEDSLISKLVIVASGAMVQRADPSASLLKRRGSPDRALKMLAAYTHSNSHIPFEFRSRLS